MKILKYKDSKGKIHTVRNVKLFTGIVDTNGVDVYEGDIIQSPANYSSNGKARLDYWNMKVSYIGGYCGKTHGGTPHYEAYSFIAEDIDKPKNSKAYRWNWSKFFACEVVNKKAKQRLNVVESEGL